MNTLHLTRNGASEDSRLVELVDEISGQLQAGAMSRNAMRRQFLSSPEFQARLAEVLGAGCAA